MTDQVKIGVIGTSWWTDSVLLPILMNSERANLAAICGRNRERADEVARKHGISQVFTDYRQMIDQGKLDAVVVATPDDTHYEMGMAALDAGLHLLCEKPVALNAGHAKEMYEKAEAAGVKHMVMYTWHWMSPMQQIKAMVDEGKIGTVYHGDFVWQASFGRNRKYQWRADAKRCNGVFSDLGSHMTQLALWMLGDVTTVSAQLGYHVEHDGLNGEPVAPANDSALVTLQFVSGAQAQIGISAVAYTLDPGGPGFVLFGEKGTVEGGLSIGNVITTYLRTGFDGSDEKVSETTPQDLPTFLSTHPAGRQFVDSILDDKLIYPGLYEGYKVQQVIDAALQSHETGCRVALPAD